MKIEGGAGTIVGVWKALRRLPVKMRRERKKFPASVKSKKRGRISLYA